MSFIRLQELKWPVSRVPHLDKFLSGRKEKRKMKGEKVIMAIVNFRNVMKQEYRHRQGRDDCQYQKKCYDLLVLAFLSAFLFCRTHKCEPFQA